MVKVVAILQPEFDSKIKVKSWICWCAFAVPALEREKQADPRDTVASQASSRSVKVPVSRTR